MSLKIVGFVQKHLCERGTTTALYDYAVANEDICKNVSIIFYTPSHPYNDLTVIRKFQQRFTLIPFYVWSDIEKSIEHFEINYLYIIKYGLNDGFITEKIPCLIHSVFAWKPHGIYACVSREIAEKNRGKWLPHIVKSLPCSSRAREIFRERYKIPLNAYVYGRYGGYNTFNISYVKNLISSEINSHPDIWFVFVNTEQFINHPRVLFLPKMIDPSVKGNFISACDAMIHARDEGETFGLSIAEFISGGKHVLTSKAITTQDNEHIALGKDWVRVYSDEESLRKLLWNPEPSPKTENPYSIFSEENVMKIFWELMDGNSQVLNN